MYSALQRLNTLTSLATTSLLILLSLISIVSLLSLPQIKPGSIDVQDLVITKGRLRRWGAKEEELASVRFDLRADLTPIFNAWNTKQVFLYLTADYTDDKLGSNHKVVLWDKVLRRPRSSKIQLNGGKNKYVWKQVSKSFRDIPSANFTLHYALMPYVGILTSGVAAKADGSVTLPEVLKR